jgi:hypothetical protein
MSYVHAECGNVDCRSGFVPVTDEWAIEQSGGDPVKFAAARNSVVPCPTDNPDGYAKWLGGHYEPDHLCADCDPRRKPK